MRNTLGAVFVGSFIFIGGSFTSVCVCPGAAVISAAFHDEAVAAERANDFGKAKRLCLLAMKEASEHPTPTSAHDYLFSATGLAAVLTFEADYEQASALLEKSTAVCQQVMQTDPSLAARVDAVWSQSLLGSGKLDEAENHLRAAIRFLETKPEEKESLSLCLNNLAHIFAERKQFEAAEPLVRQAIAVAGESPVPLCVALDTLAEILHQQDRHAEALALAKKALSISSALGEAPLAAAGIHDTLGDIYVATGNHKEAEHHYSENARINKHRRHSKHHEYHDSLTSLREILDKTEQTDRAAEVSAELDKVKLTNED